MQQPRLGQIATAARRRGITGALLLAVVLVARPAPAQTPYTDPYGPIEYNFQSQYSRIRIRATEKARTLLFVRDSGEEVVESMVDLKRPFHMLVEYTRSMFLSYVHRPEQRKVVIVGLGGGAMVHFLRHYDPPLKVDVVEIDPAIIDVADRLFGVRTGGNVRVFQDDGVKYLAETRERYDVIYMDAFLKPSEDTDATGVPKRMKTADFYARMREVVSPGGLVVFNVNPHDRVAEDLALIRRSFGQTYVYAIPAGGFVVVAAEGSSRLDPQTLRQRARATDRRLRATFSLERLVQNLQP